MGKSLQSATMLHDLSRFVSSPKPHNHTPNQTQPILLNPGAANSGAYRLEYPPAHPKIQTSDLLKCRIPLAEVVADCTHRWFQDTLKEANAGDASMQLLVAQMYSSGYGVPRDPQKAHSWISKASRTRSTVWNASNEHPGYRGSDSNSEELGDIAK
ncbi:uncharacterized protein G2W53_030503 [Senna tora]|uniref:Sel1-like protein n=1 Tax=Senna tora TaxID=362788 RepID=A0A834T6J0_9FABA|nr:uncharacterized protein G2W53_030503 [Senna tora]